MSEIIRVHLRKPESSWKKIEDMVMEKNRNKTQPSKGKGLTKYMTNEINRIFRDLHIDQCEEITSIPKEKCFKILVSDEVAGKVNSLANNLGMRPSDLICRLILDPNLFK